MIDDSVQWFVVLLMLRSTIESRKLYLLQKVASDLAGYKLKPRLLPLA